MLEIYTLIELQTYVYNSFHELLCENRIRAKLYVYEICIIKRNQWNHFIKDIRSND